MNQQIDTPTPLSTSYAHPLDAALLGGAPLLLAALCVHPAPAVLYLYLTGRIAESVVGHSGLSSGLVEGVCLKRLPLRAGVAHHDAHHRCELGCRGGCCWGCAALGVCCSGGLPVC